jgi:hypothetical protein
MTWEEIKTKQQQELDEYATNRKERWNTLLQDQREIVTHCIVTHPKAYELLTCLLKDQRVAWERNEKDERDALRHAHTMEKERFEKRQCTLAFLKRERTHDRSF